MLSFHPVASIFPLIEGEEFDRLCENIRDQGLLTPIWLHPDGTIIDGRNRYRACQAAEVEPQYRIWDESGSLIEFSMSLNLHRRHLTSGQRSAVAVVILPHLEAEARERQLAALKQNVSVQEFFPERTDQGQARDKAAALTNTNGRYVSDAKKIKDKAPEVFDQLRSGEVSMSKAQEEVLGKKTKDTKRVKAKSNNVWHTPSKYIESARRVMGAIDLDPASDVEANEVIRATTYFTEEDDGLKQDWFGRVWCNPPYDGGGAKFSAKFIEEYEAGRVLEAVLLVNSNSTETGWFKTLWPYLLCFTDHRIDFSSPDNPDAKGSTHGSVFVYLGANRDMFIEEFSQYGVVVEKAI